MVDTIDSINDLICNVKEAMKDYFYDKSTTDDLLDEKSDTDHTHIIDDVTDLQDELDGKSDTNHTHGIADVTNLQSALDGKASTSHNHNINGITGLNDALNGKADSSHTHSISNVTGLQNALDGKAASSHNHDDRYYTETESDAKYALKTHNHDSVYASKGDLNTFAAKYKKTDAVRVRLIRTNSSGVPYPQDDELTHEGAGLEVNVGDKLGAKVYTTDNSISVANQEVLINIGSTVKRTTTDNNGITRDLTGLNNQQNAMAYAILKGTNTFNKSIDIKYVIYNTS